jgi:hypothetical protein
VDRRFKIGRTLYTTYDVEMGDRDVNIAVQPDGKLTGGEGIAGLPVVAHGGQSVDCCPSLEGRERLRVGVEVRVICWGEIVGVWRGGTPAVSGCPRRGFGLGTVWVLVIDPIEWLSICGCRGEVRVGSEHGRGRAPGRSGVKWRGVEYCGRMGEHAVEG